MQTSKAPLLPRKAAAAQQERRAGGTQFTVGLWLYKVGVHLPLAQWGVLRCRVRSWARPLHKD